MKTRHLYFLSAVTIVLVAAAGMFVYAISRTASPPIPVPSVATSPQSQAAVPTSTLPAIASADYSCDGSKTISAVFTSGTVQLALSDGRELTMPQTISGSGIRYEQGQGTQQDIVFWSEGPNAFLSENGTNTYEDCVAGTTAAQANTDNTFTDQGQTFSLTYPSNLSVMGSGIGYTQNWMENATTTGLVLAELDVPSSTQPNTNFDGAKLTVGTSADASALAGCLTTVGGFTQQPSSTQVTIGGVPFVKFTYGGAAAGSFYDTTSYRTLRNSQCYAVEYTIHSTDIGVYPPDAGISAFDEQKVESALDGIVQSFTFLGPDQAAAANPPPASSPISTGQPATGSATMTVTMQSSGTTIHLKKGQSFLLNLGNLKWTLSFDPTDIVSKIPGSPESNGFQGAYGADSTGTTTLQGIGAPICNPGEACPMFRVNFTLTIVVS